MFGFQKPIDISNDMFATCVRGGVFGAAIGGVTAFLPLVGSGNWKIASATSGVAAVVRSVAECIFPAEKGKILPGWKPRAVRVMTTCAVELGVALIANVGVFLLLGRALVVSHLLSATIQNNGLQGLLTAINSLHA